MELFKKLLDYGEYLKEYPFHKNLEIDVEDFSNLEKKLFEKQHKYSVSGSIHKDAIIMKPPYGLQMRKKYHVG